MKFRTFYLSSYSYGDEQPILSEMNEAVQRFYNNIGEENVVSIQSCQIENDLFLTVWYRGGENYSN